MALGSQQVYDNMVLFGGKENTSQYKKILNEVFLSSWVLSAYQIV